MKKVFYLLSFLAVFASCSNDEKEIQPEEEQLVEIQESTALRISLEQFKKSVQQNFTNNNTVEATGLCFQFEYPIVLEYNTGTQVTVEDYEQLLEVLLGETMAVHITAIGFPFNVIQYSDNSSRTITTESDFQTLIAECGYDPVEVTDILGLTENCFSVNYPVTVLVNDEAQIFNSQIEAEDFFFANVSTIHSINLEYPLSVTLIETGSEVQINTDFDLIYLINTTCGIN